MVAAVMRMVSARVACRNPRAAPMDALVSVAVPIGNVTLVVGIAYARPVRKPVVAAVMRMVTASQVTWIRPAAQMGNPVSPATTLRYVVVFPLVLAGSLHSPSPTPMSIPGLRLGCFR